MDVAVGLPRPALDARIGSLDARAVAEDVVSEAAVGRRRGITCPAARRLHQRRHHVFGAREDERVAVTDVLGQALVGLARDARDREAPADAAGPIALARVVLQRELGMKSDAPRRREHWHRERTCSRRWIGRELLADVANCAAALR